MCHASLRLAARLRNRGWCWGCFTPTATQGRTRNAQHIIHLEQYVFFFPRVQHLRRPSAPEFFRRRLAPRSFSKRRRCLKSVCVLQEARFIAGPRKSGRRRRGAAGQECGQRSRRNTQTRETVTPQKVEHLSTFILPARLDDHLKKGKKKPACKHSI